MNKILILSLVLSLTSCIKTAEQVQREKRFENMSEQMKDSQGLVADLIGQMKDMQSQLDKLNGKVEELEHRQKQVKPDELHKMAENMNQIKTQQESEATQLLQIQNELKEQRVFIEKVTKSLDAMGKEAAAPKRSQKKSAKEELNSAIELVNKHKYSAAREGLEALINNPDLNPSENNKLFHGLGRVEYNTKNYDQALVYFSKIYTKYPKATLAPSSLLFIGRTLKKMGKNDEGKEAFNKLIEDYPKSKEAKEVKHEL
jgi:TolA-binding protein